jgi:hypothetical protein
MNQLLTCTKTPSAQCHSDDDNSPKIQASPYSPTSENSENYPASCYAKPTKPPHNGKPKIDGKTYLAYLKTRLHAEGVFHLLSRIRCIEMVIEPAPKNHGRVFRQVTTPFTSLHQRLNVHNTHARAWRRRRTRSGTVGIVSWVVRAIIAIVAGNHLKLRLGMRHWRRNGRAIFREW